MGVRIRPSYPPDGVIRIWPLTSLLSSGASPFVDGQNLFNAAKFAYGYQYPNYGVLALTKAVCAQEGWRFIQTRFYTGVPSKEKDEAKHTFWHQKTRAMKRKGVQVFTRKIRYRDQSIRLGDGTKLIRPVAQEKGVDIRIAIESIRYAFSKDYDVALIFRQDQDFSEAVDEIKQIASKQGRWIKVASAYPVSPACRNKRGINGTDWIPIDREFYDRCIDPADYRKPLR